METRFDQARMGPEGFEPQAPRDSVVGHVAVGLGLTLAAVLVSELMGRKHKRLADREDAMADYAELQSPVASPPKAMFNLAWPPLFMALTLSGLKVWNAPRGEARTKALTLWSLATGFNVLWMALGPRRLGGRVATATAALGTAAAFGVSATKVGGVDNPFSNPYVGWMGLAGAMNDNFWKRVAPSKTVH
jgi:tryptophan-rich sensory protein